MSGEIISSWDQTKGASWVLLPKRIQSKSIGNVLLLIAANSGEGVYNSQIANPIFALDPYFGVAFWTTVMPTKHFRNCLSIRVFLDAKFELGGETILKVKQPIWWFLIDLLISLKITQCRVQCCASTLHQGHTFGIQLQSYFEQENAVTLQC